jgi:DNA end-binding protein Ku
MFVPRNTIEWIWLERPHYLSPSDEVGHEAFSVIRDAMEAEKVVGISRLVIGRRERAVMLEPCGKGIVVWTLRYGDEVRKPESYFGDIGDGDNDPKLMDLVTKVIEERSKPWNPNMVRDPVQEKLLEIIESKRKSAKKGAKPIGKGDEPAYTGNVIDLMSALKESLEKKQSGRKKS